jgi:hypothetical protein
MAYTIQRGESIYVKIDDTAIECLTQADYSSSAGEIDTTCKNTAGTTTTEVGAITAAFTIGGNYTDGTGSNKDFHTLHVAHLARTTVEAKWGGLDVGDKTYTADCKIMSISASAGNTGSLVTWTAELKAVEAVAVATIA